MWIRSLIDCVKPRPACRPARRAQGRLLRVEAREDRTLPSFMAPVAYPVGTGPQAVTTADLTGNGKLDLITANAGGNTLSVLTGNGNGTFQAAQNYAVGSQPVSVTVGDFDGRHYASGQPVLDLAVANEGSNSVSVLMGNGDGTFQAAKNYAVGSQPVSVAVGYFDGKLDIVTANQGDNTVSLLPGNGDGTFGTSRTAATFNAPAQSVAVGDFNADGKLDLAVATRGTDGSSTPGISGPYGYYPGTYNLGYSPAVNVLMGNGNGTFAAGSSNTLPSPYGVPPSSFAPPSVAVADLNGDGKLDLVATVADASFGPGGMSVFPGNGNGTSGNSGIFATGSSPQAVAVADLNGDGKLDLVTTDGGGTLSVLPGNGNGSFGSPDIFNVGSSLTSVAAGDFTGDGKADLAVADAGGNNVPVLLNTGDWPSLQAAATDPVTGAAITSTTAGSTFNFTVTAKDPLGNVLTGFADTVQFTNGAPQATVIDPTAGSPVALQNFTYTFTAADHGTHTFAVDLKTAGTQSISVSDPTAGVTATDSGITVNPAAASIFVVAGFPSPIAQEDTEPFTVTAEDPYGNTATGYTGTVHFTSSDAQAILPADVTLTSGTGSFNATLETVGTQSITATDTATPTVTGSQTGIQVVPLSFQVSFLPSVSAGVAEDLTVWAVGPSGDVTGYSGTVHLTSSDSRATILPAYGGQASLLPADVNLSGGYGEFYVTFNTAGDQSITATDAVHPSVSASVTGIQVVPRAGISGPSAGMPNQTLTYTLGAGGDPPGTVFTYQIDWNSGGSVDVDQTVTGTSGLTVTHAFSTAGNYAVYVRAIDANGFTSAWTWQSINIVPVSVAIQADPANTSRQMLVIDGSASNDSIVLGSGANNGVTLSFDGAALGNILPTNGNPFALVVVYDQGSNDTIDARSLAISAVLEGGGNSDLLYGGSARNLLIAGPGTATLYAGSAGDILIGGTTSYDNNRTALAYIMAEWDSTDGYTTRVKKLQNGGGLNGSYVLNSTTVFDNNATASLYGGSGLDWFFAHLKGKNQDKVIGQTSGEVVTGI